MDAYEEKIFEYLTKGDNFEYAYEIYQQFPKVKDKLITEFWRLLQSKLEAKTNDSEWGANIFEEITDNYPKVGLSLDSDHGDTLCVIFEEHRGDVYYGIWVDAKKITNISDLKSRVDNISEVKRMIDQNNNYWLTRANIEDNFNNIQTLKRMLPGGREEFAEELAGILYNFAKTVKKDVKEMSEMVVTN